jgi:hypothetical protein
MRAWCPLAIARATEMAEWALGDAGRKGDFARDRRWNAAQRRSLPEPEREPEPEIGNEEIGLGLGNVRVGRFP